MSEEVKEDQEVKEEEKEEKKEKEAQQDNIPNLKKVLGDFDGAPSQEQIEAWKAEHGEVFVSGFSETELYVWRPLMRPEYKQLQTNLQDPENQIDQWKYEEMVCETCVLWRSTNQSWDKVKAGCASTLLEQIFQNSNFMAPAAASLFVAKL